MRIAILLITLLAFSTASYGAGEQPSRQTYLRLMEAQEAWEEDNYPQAVAVLQEALEKAVDKPYDIAIIQQYLAHTAILSGDEERVRPALESALQQPDLPLGLQADIKLFLGQIVLGAEEYEEALELLEFWYANREAEAQPTNLFSLSYAYYMTGDLPRAEQFVEMAVNATSKPNDSWLQIYYQVLFEQKKYDKALGVLHGLLNRDPGESRYWRMLANHHLQIEESLNALAALSIAYNGEMLDDVSDLKRVAALYNFVEIPEKAARLTEQWMSEGKIEEDAETLRKLGELWLLSRDRGKAKGYFKRAGAANNDVDTIELLGSLHFEDEEWALAHAAFVEVLNAVGGRDADGEIIELEDPLRLNMLAGISAYRAGMESEARTYLRRASEDEEFRSQARSMLRKLDDS